MEPGTCSPFPLENSVGREVTHLLVYDHPSIDDSLTDISIGGIGVEAHKVSMHILYSGIHRILKQKFGDRVSRFS